MRERMTEGRRTAAVTPFLLGVIATLLGVIAFGDRPVLTTTRADDDGLATEERASSGGPAHAPGARAADDGLWPLTCLMQGGNEELLCLVDTRARRVAVYRLNTGAPALVGVRNVDHDLGLDLLPVRNAPRPTPSEVQKMLEDAQKKAEEKAEEKRKKDGRKKKVVDKGEGGG